MNEIENKPDNGKAVDRITAITIEGYKSIYDRQRIELRPLTVFAGANSSGKSSAIQPLLLMKQTLEASYDPGALLLNGPYVKFSSTDQLLSSYQIKQGHDFFAITIDGDADVIKPTDRSTTFRFKKEIEQGFILEELTFNNWEGKYIFRENMREEDILKNLPARFTKLIQTLKPPFLMASPQISINREKCFFAVRIYYSGDEKKVELERLLEPARWIKPHLYNMIHLPGLRGNPERVYPTTAVGDPFPGLFQNYVASILNNWQKQKDTRLEKLSLQLESLGLTWKVAAKKIDDTSIELRVGRLARSEFRDEQDLVNIADVGLGISQVMPVLVALLIAEPGRIVYIEQPELHLHPSAQHKLAVIIAEASKRGVIVIIETHSSILLLGIQALVAEGKLDKELVKLHWFSRAEDGATKIDTADLDDEGAFGDWPEDFGKVELAAESRYLDASIKFPPHN
ncbi:MAG: DUF3696 domain-containing protein [Bacteroidetes bacterium]|nr:MAG: DUF3696 domain-containing protein [Bacteroidota bacterium]